MHNYEISVVNNCLIRMAGNESGPLLICIAGYADNGTMYLPLFSSTLLNDFKLAAIDLPGTGSSPTLKTGHNSLEDYANCLSQIIECLNTSQIGLIGHSIASPICIRAANKVTVGGIFSIEGNLTEADAYFTGRAAKFESAAQFWTAQRMHIKAIGYDDPVLQRYYAAATFADPTSMWELGRDAVRHSKNDGFGREFVNSGTTTHYFWSSRNTPKESSDFLEKNAIANTHYDGSHWPTLDATAETAAAIDMFFRPIFL